MITLTLSLVSHTNVGKTTLARTLLRRDVGEVLDQPHVTEVSEAYTLIETEGERLQLWDTPGLGDTLRLVRRLRQHENPLGWFLHQVVDRSLNRPLWCSQEALRNVRADADAVLYIVNATESPQDAGYVDLELEILAWLGRPTLVLLNQTGGAGDASARLVQEWSAYLRAHDIVRDVLPMDAFARSWIQENILFDHVALLFEGERRDAMARLAGAWRERNLEVYRRSIAWIARDLARATVDREPLPGALASGAQKREAMDALAGRLDASQEALWTEVIREHGLDGRSAEEARRNLDAFAISGEAPLTAERGALIGGVVSGAIGGLAADLLSGGLSFGGGMLAGAILGALGGAGLSRAVRLGKGDEVPTVGWAPEFLDQLLERFLLRYLAIAHFGRGRGTFAAGTEPETWRQAVREVLSARRGAFARHWNEGASRSSPELLEPGLRQDLRITLDDVLARVHSDAA